MQQTTQESTVMSLPLDITRFLPAEHTRAALVGRVFDPEENGPCIVAVRGDRLVDITHLAPTMSDLFENPDALDIVRNGAERRSWALTDIRTQEDSGPAAAPRLLAPIDLQVIKAAGVTFAKSMIERVIEERAAGDAHQAETIRAHIDTVIGGAISGIRPGSEEAQKVKEVLIAEGLWSQYLEVGIGPDPEIFTKAPVLSAVGAGSTIGILARSTWNNPEPEVVLAVTSTGRVVGATLGNDVNLRDFEGRSALLLTEAKDNNASCSIGPFVRLFDESFDLDTVRELVIDLEVVGPDGYHLQERSLVSQMSRTFEELVDHAIGSHHQYPDGFVLFTGTLFAPTQDRDDPGMGFTHHIGDTVTISTPSLGALTNTVSTAEDAPNWTFGIRHLMQNLQHRGLLNQSQPVR
jgi:fumarylacetoacetate (FAA) hydrolase family protein